VYIGCLEEKLRIVLSLRMPRLGIRGSIFCVICVAGDITNPFVLALRWVVYFSVRRFSLYQRKNQRVRVAYVTNYRLSKIKEAALT
jgi:hypothetical protein